MDVCKRVRLSFRLDNNYRERSYFMEKDQYKYYHQIFYLSAFYAISYNDNFTTSIVNLYRLAYILFTTLVLISI